MRKVLFVFFIVTFICSCGPSMHEKAEAFAEKTVKGSLKDISSYEPVETIVDSLFWNISFDLEVRKTTRRLIALRNEQDSTARAYEEAKRTLENATEHHRRPLVEETAQQLKRLEEEMRRCEAVIVEKYQKAEKSYFYGWSLLHRFYINDEQGRKRQTWAIVLTDQQMESTIYDEVIFEQSYIHTEVCNTILEVLHKDTLLK